MLKPFQTGRAISWSKPIKNEEAKGNARRANLFNRYHRRESRKFQKGSLLLLLLLLLLRLSIGWCRGVIPTPVQIGVNAGLIGVKEVAVA